MLNSNESILLSYGEKSADGKRFIKSDESREAFSQTAAFDTLFMELATEDEAASNFIKGILPKDLSLEIEKAILPPPNIQPVSNTTETE